jgi:hypothetical protein
MADDRLEDREPSLVETVLLAVEDAQAARLEQYLRLSFLFESDPAKAAEIASWLP